MSGKQGAMATSPPLALDLILKSFLKSSAFNELQEKNWSAISRLIPGTTPKQVQRRYEELYQQSFTSGVCVNLGRPLSQCSSSSQRGAVRSESDHRSSRPGSAKFKGNKSDKDSSSGKLEDKRPGSADQSFLANYLKKKMPKVKLKYYHVVSSDYDDSSQPFTSFPSINTELWNKEDSSPVMVIHVCDEAKNLKQDFHCPRDLLVREMRYFAEYLTTDAQRWEEVDISVHCDVQIFDWLMNYVKRTSKDAKEPPKLEPNNVISILISSDFLKMDNLVSECIKYCHENMTAIVSTPCNMNCINDKLVSSVSTLQPHPAICEALVINQISDLFNHNEADMIKDRKDKFKSKLFAKKLERLFDVDGNNPDSPESAATLFRCGICKKYLTKVLEKKVSCMQSRLQIDKEGKLTYNHVRDTNWDVNDYLIDLKQQLKTWRDVYWRVWGTINSLTCSRCRETFPCTELGHCRYHPESAVYDISILEGTGGVAKSVIGVYPCCEQKNLRFDPTQPNTGCKVRDHVVDLGDSISLSGSTENIANESSKNKVYDDLLAHRDAICVPYAPLVSHAKEDTELNIFHRDEQASGMKEPSTGNKTEAGQVDDHSKTEVNTRSGTTRPQPRLQALTVERSLSRDDDIGMGESEDELGDDEENKDAKVESGDKWKQNLMVLKGVASWMKLRKSDTEDDEIDKGTKKEPSKLKDSDFDSEWEPRTTGFLPYRRLASLSHDIPKTSFDMFDDAMSMYPGRRPRVPRRSKVTVDPQAILLDAPDFGSTKMRKWDSSRSMRWNQDAQREEDQRRMNEIINYLTKLRVNQDKVEKQRQKEYVGGLYSKLEAQWKAVNMPPPRTGGPQIRSKPRLNTLKSSLA